MPRRNRNKSNREERFNWTKQTVPKFSLPQCSDCEHNEDGEACEILGRPRPEEYVRNEKPCPWRIKIAPE